eukprot:TRINITY_DN358_c0_g1_i3.p1 TRINITY_DN358_c0_g1~~TRINITY_DN358_c0_g1_i3.p1  ORF type:complete len:554 (-),score=64.39 TRINITY_DN358_c0_g1_i3:1265-2926(-)
MHYCTHDASFDAQAEPLKDIKTVYGYSEWMKGIALVAMPGSSYELHSQSFDAKTNTVLFFGTFHGTHSGHLEGFPAPTHKSMETQYVYSIHVNAHGKVDRITKVWHSAWAAAQVGWTPPSNVPADAVHLFHACESGKGWHECMHFCTHDASFSAQAEPLQDIQTVHAYAEWMKGIAVVAMPGSSYVLHSSTFDPHSSTAVFVGTFRGTHSGHLHGFPAPTHKSMDTQYVYSMHVNGNGKVDRITKVWHSAWAAAQVGWTPATSIPADAENLFHACESGKGWQGCLHYCTHDAVFSAQAEPLKDIKTMQGYAEWMKGIAVVAMPGSSYELNASSFDPKTSTATFFGTFRGTHTGHLHGFPDPTHKSMETQYVYSMHVNVQGKVNGITKVWHSAWAAAQVGWTPPSSVPAYAEHLFHACESGKGWRECSRYCTHDAAFSAQAEPLKGISTVYAYTEWMKPRRTSPWRLSMSTTCMWPLVGKLTGSQRYGILHGPLHKWVGHRSRVFLLMLRICSMLVKVEEDGTRLGVSALVMLLSMRRPSLSRTSRRCMAMQSG